MHSFGEFPKEENVSRLSQILEENPLPKYCLSPKACQGILRRAENRGKELPPMLKEALIRQSVSKNVLEGNGQRESHQGDGYKESDTMYTLNTVEQHGVCYGIDRASFNQGKNAQYDFSIKEEMAQTLVSKGPGGAVVIKQ